MKKNFIILAIVFFAFNLNAQWFLGGGIDINVNSVINNDIRNSIDHTTKMTEVGFMISPKAFYHFNEKFALGLSFSVGPNFLNRKDTNYYYEYRGFTINWRVLPFIRYSIFTYKKFALILEGRTGIGGTHSFYKNEDIRIGKNNTVAIGVFNITPILSFSLTDHLQLEGGLHFLNIGYNIDISKRESESYKSNSTKHDFNIGFNSSSILVVTQLQIGAVYKF